MMSMTFGPAMAWLGRRPQLRAPYYAMKTMISQLKGFDSVKMLSPGAYKFIVAGKPVYVLWGNGGVPPEITGVVKVVRVIGSPSIQSASWISLSPDPVFVTMLYKRR